MKHEGGLGRRSGIQADKGHGLKELERYMRPEFIGRLDDVIVFRPLSRANMENIVVLELKKITKRLVEHGLKIEITEEAKEFLVEKGTSSDFGARPLRRAIEQNVEDPLSEDILRGAFKDKDMIKITVKTPEVGDKHLFFEASSTRGKEDAKQLAKATSDAT